MAILNSRQSGNFTAATTWGVVDNTSFLNSTANASNTTTTYVESQTFTPGAITIDAIGIRLNGVLTNSGTFSVRLALGGVTVVGTEVTINVSDINTNSVNWTLMKFAAPVTLLAATNYTVSVRSSVATTVSVFRNATGGNWSRFLRTTATAAPAATDTLIVSGEHVSAGVNSTFTVTYDNTANTVFGQLSIDEKGILNAETNASTNYRFTTSADIAIRGNGVMQIGTSGNPIPASSSFIIQLNQGGVNVNFGILITNNAVFRTFGAAKTSRVFLAADAAIAATNLTTNVSTGWLSGEEIVIASTTITSTQQEIRTLTANASGTTVPVAALSFAHGGVAPFIAEVGNLTRNIKIQSDSASFGTYMSNSTASVVDFNNTEFKDMGSATANRRGFDVLTSTGSLNISGCSFNKGQTSAFALLLNQTTNNNITLNDNVFLNYSTGISTNNPTGSNWSLNNLWFFAAPATFNLQAGTVNNITGTGASTINIAPAGNLGVSYSNITAHSNNTGVVVSTGTFSMITVNNITTWRNTRGLSLTGVNFIVNNHNSYGNSFAGISVSSAIDCNVQNSTYSGSVVQIQPSGVVCETSSLKVTFDNCTMSGHTTGDVTYSTVQSWHDLVFNACTFNSSTEVATPVNMPFNTAIYSSRHDNTAGSHRTFKRIATLTSDSVITATAPLSQRWTPASATAKTIGFDKTFAIPSGKTAVISVGVRRSVAGDGTAYNGALPRLWLRKNISGGLTTDTLLATATAASAGAFEFLTGSIPSSSDNTVYSLYIDLDGTAGWVNIDLWKLFLIDANANNSNVSTEDFWQNGSSFNGINTVLTLNTGNETYWQNGTPVRQLYPITGLQTGKFFLQFN